MTDEQIKVFDEQIKVFDDLQTDLIGPEEEATLDPPTQDENGVLRGGTWFDLCKRPLQARQG